MSDIAPINGTGNLLLNISGRRTADSTADKSSESSLDRLELSDISQVLAKLSPSTPIRAEKVAQIRDAIQNGTYEQPGQMERVDRLMDVLGLR